MHRLDARRDRRGRRRRRPRRTDPVLSSAGSSNWRPCCARPDQPIPARGPSRMRVSLSFSPPAPWRRHVRSSGVATAAHADGIDAARKAYLGRLARPGLRIVPRDDDEGRARSPTPAARLSPTRTTPCSSRRSSTAGPARRCRPGGPSSRRKKPAWLVATLRAGAAMSGRGRRCRLGLVRPAVCVGMISRRARDTVSSARCASAHPRHGRSRHHHRARRRAGADRRERAAARASARSRASATLSHASAVFSRDGRYAYVFGRDGGLTKVDLLEAQLAKRDHPGRQLPSAAPSRQDGTLVAVSNYEPGGVKVFDADTLDLVADIPATRPTASASKVVGPGRRGGQPLRLQPVRRGRNLGRRPVRSARGRRSRNSPTSAGSRTTASITSTTAATTSPACSARTVSRCSICGTRSAGVRRILDGYGKGEEPLPVYKMPHLRRLGDRRRHCVPAGGRAARGARRRYPRLAGGGPHSGRTASRYSPSRVPTADRSGSISRHPLNDKVQVIDVPIARRRPDADAGQGGHASGVHADAASRCGSRRATTTASTSTTPRRSRELAIDRRRQAERHLLHRPRQPDGVLTMPATARRRQAAQRFPARFSAGATAVRADRRRARLSEAGRARRRCADLRDGGKISRVGAVVRPNSDRRQHARGHARAGADGWRRGGARQRAPGGQSQLRARARDQSVVRRRRAADAAGVGRSSASDRGGNAVSRVPRSAARSRPTTSIWASTLRCSGRCRYRPAPILARRSEDGLPLTPRPSRRSARRRPRASPKSEVDRAILRTAAGRAVSSSASGSIVRHHALGYRANAMVVWDVPDDRVVPIGRPQALGHCRSSPCAIGAPAAARLAVQPVLHDPRHAIGRRREQIADGDEAAGLGELSARGAVQRAARFKQRGARYVAASGEERLMDDLDRRIVNGLQGGFPITEWPFADAAAGCSASPKDELIARIERLCAEGRLSRFGPMFHADRLGGALTLAAMAVPDGRLRRRRGDRQRASRGRAQLRARARAQHVVRPRHRNAGAHRRVLARHRGGDRACGLRHAEDSKSSSSSARFEA